MGESAKKPTAAKKVPSKSKEIEKKHTGTNYSRGNKSKIVIEESRKKPVKKSAQTINTQYRQASKHETDRKKVSSNSRSSSNSNTVKKSQAATRKPEQSVKQHPQTVKKPQQVRETVRKPVEEVYYEIPEFRINFKIIGLVLAVLLVCFGLYKGIIQPARNKKLEESRSHLYKIGYLVLDENIEIKIEAGKPLTYDDSPVELKNVPVEFRPFIKEYASGCEINIWAMETNELGRQEVIFKTTLKDDYGQSIDIYQPSYYEVVDTSDPVVTLKKENVSCDGTFSSIISNVESVVDPIYGPYEYSTRHENHTWWIDTHWMNYCKRGQYTGTVVVYDNGRVFETDFGITIDKDRKSVFR